MGCGCGSSCDCSTCQDKHHVVRAPAREPFVIDGLGRWREMPASPPPRKTGTSSSSARAALRGEPMGARLSRSWTGTAGGHVSHTTSSPLGVGASRTTSFGIGIAPAATPPSMERPVLPIGARPSVAERASVSFQSIDKPVMPPPDPYGTLPLELLPERVFGIAVPGAGGGHQYISDVVPADSERALRQYIPPVPASQEVAFVNGFDSHWGTPPLTFNGVAMQYDPRIGAYAGPMKDLGGAHRTPQVGNPAARLNIQKQYASGLMLQPYKRADATGPDAPWYFRWIAQRRQRSTAPHEHMPLG